MDALSCECRCVGKVRDLVVQRLIKQGCDWIACTDTYSLVELDWLTEQLNHLQQSRVVSVDSWEHLSNTRREDYIAHYQDCMRHRHIHGANLSFTSQEHVAMGGFDAIGCHKDVQLVKKFELAHLPII